MWYVLGGLFFLAAFFLMVGFAVRPSVGSRSRHQAPRTRTRVGIRWESQFKNTVLLVLGLLGCHGLVYAFWPEWWWLIVWNQVSLLDHVVVLVVFSLFRKDDKRGKKVLAPGVGLVLTILVAGNLWVVGGWLVEESAKARADAQARQQAVVAAQAVAEAALPKEFEVIAPVGVWSERIPTLHGEIIRYHGPVLRRDDKYNVVERDDVATNPNMTPVLQTAWVQFQSRTQEPVKVTVSR